MSFTFLVRCTYGKDALEKREPVRPAHRKYLADYKEDLRYAGPTILDNGRPTGSMAIIDGSRTHARRFIEGEPFFLAGLFETITIVRFHPQTNLRQRDLTMNPSKRIYLCRWTGEPEPLFSMVHKTSHEVLEYGPMTDDSCTKRVGEFLIVAVDSHAHFDPRSGFSEQTASALRVDRWRFGYSIGDATRYV